jgi:hypothetical protein
MSAVTRTAALNNGSSTVVTVTLPGEALASGQANTRVASYVNASGVSVEATVALPGYTPVAGSE